LYNPELKDYISNETKKYDEYNFIIEKLNKNPYTDDEVRSYVDNKIIIENLPESIPLVKRMMIYQDSMLEVLRKGSIENYQQIIDNENYLTSL
jgi:hypothetical protein